MHHDEQDALLVTQAEQPAPDRHLRREVELVPAQLGHPRVQLRRRYPLDGNPLGPRGLRRGYRQRLALLLVQHGVQRLVARDHIGEGGPQRAGPDRAVELERQRDVVERIGPLELVEQPEATLRVRHGPRGAGPGHDRRYGHGYRGRADGVHRLQPRREGLHRRGFEQVAQLYR